MSNTEGKVSLIYYTGFGIEDPLFAARLLAYTKNTRLEQGEDTLNKFMTAPEEIIGDEMDYVSKTLRSSWEFIDYTFQIRRVSRAFTHQLVRTRNASYAQQAMRVVDMGHFDTVVPDTVETSRERRQVWDDVMETIQDGYVALQELGVPNQDCRGVLPTNVCTNIMVKINLRALADVIAKRKNLRAQGEYGFIASEMERCVLEVHPWAEEFLNPTRTQTPALDRIMKELLGDGSPIDRPEVNAALKELDALKGTWG